MGVVRAYILDELWLIGIEVGAFFIVIFIYCFRWMVNISDVNPCGITLLEKVAKFVF